MVTGLVDSVESLRKESTERASCRFGQLGLPVENVDQLLAIDGLIVKEEEKKSMVICFSSSDSVTVMIPQNEYFNCVPGEDLNELVRNLMARLMNKRVALNLNYSGGKEPFSFKRMNLNAFITRK
jgi:hypothetical protein